MEEFTEGKKIACAIGVWLIIKGILNLILGFSIGNLLTLVVSVLLAALLLQGIPYLNYITAVLVGLVVLKNLGYNIRNFEVLYLVEAVIDVVCVVLLVANKQVKEYFQKD